MIHGGGLAGNVGRRTSMPKVVSGEGRKNNQRDSVRGDDISNLLKGFAASTTSSFRNRGSARSKGGNRSGKVSQPGVNEEEFFEMSGQVNGEVSGPPGFVRAPRNRRGSNESRSVSAGGSVAAEEDEDAYAGGNADVPSGAIRYDAAIAGYFSQDSAYTLSRMNRAFYYAAATTLVTWQTLITLVYIWTPRVHFRMLNESELRAASLGGAVLFVSLLTKLTPIIVPSRKGGKRTISGAMMGACVVQFIALTSSFMMALFPVPILTDPMTKVEVYLPRISEWTALAFLMTFLTEGVDPEQFNPDKPLWYNLRVQIASAAAQSISTACALVFPICPNKYWWYFTMAISCLLYGTIFPRCWSKWRTFKNTPKGQSAEQLEMFDRARLAFQLVGSCTVLWTIFVLEYFAESLLPAMIPRLRCQSIGFIMEACVEVTSKVIYLHLIVDVHKSVYDDGARAARRLEELRRMMSVVWECSSDAIAISVKGIDGKVTTMLSPTFLKIGCIDEMDIPEGLTAVVFEQEAQEFSEQAQGNAGDLQGVGKDNDGFGKNGSKRRLPPEDPDSDYCCVDVSDGQKIYVHDPNFHYATRKGLLSMRKLMVEAWGSKEKDAVENLLLHDLALQNGSSVRCEAKVTRLEPNALVTVVRDVSERYMRFEAEKKAIHETTAREKDEQANRFTRHEVKNGLLAAMALCDTIKDSIMPEEGQDSGDHNPVSAIVPNLSPQTSAGSEVPGEPSQRKSLDGLLDTARGGFDQTTDNLFRLGISAAITELDSTLKEVLDTVLAEAMARDVIHEVYEPKTERVDLQAVLCSPRAYGDAALSRFPLVTNPSPLPIFVLDPQLFRYIHRNAISNACKYGMKGGMVLTEVRYYAEEQQLEMNVINLPGDQHQMLLDRGNEAEEAVFSPQMRLHAQDDKDGTGLHSEGDGAWISKKCAKTFGGDCFITFEVERTVFTLKCPAQVFTFPKNRPSGGGGQKDMSQFKLPENTWGIAIDDSKIQRKLMHRFFSLVGITPDRQIVVGKDAEEIHGFNDMVKKQLDEHDDAYFLLIVDENLEVTDDVSKSMTVSGSKSVQKLIQEIDPSQERRTLALIRSANDSAVDIEKYKSRAHGFFPKAPIKREKVVEMLGPLWTERFPDSHLDAEYDEGDEIDIDIFVSSAADLMQTLEVIDALCVQNKAVLPTRWPVLWEKLHSLKGDLKTIQQSKLVTDVLDSIERMRGDELPEDFISKWKVIRGVIVTIIRC